MAVDTPERIAILGAGPIGLEAALYARYLGFDVDLYDRGRVAEHLRQWGHIQLFTPFSANSSPLALAALAAQDPNWKAPAPNALLTGSEFAEGYCAALSQSDLLADSIHEQTEVLAVGRSELLKGDLPGDERDEGDFRLLLRAHHGARESAGERFAVADVVIDATGTYGQHIWLGRGGIPAIGELAAASQIEYGLPDVLGRDRERYAHRHTLVVGASHAAASTVTALARLGHEAPYTRITWLVQSGTVSQCGAVLQTETEANSGPIHRMENDPWPDRDQRARAANQLIRGEIGHLTFWPGTAVEQVVHQGSGEPFHIRLAGRHAGEMEVDRIIGNVGFRPNSQLYAELHVVSDPLTDAPTQWLGRQEAKALVTAEPDFYVLGAKSAGRESRFTIADGLNQVRQLFTIIGDRPDLDLYRCQYAGLDSQPPDGEN